MPRRACTTTSFPSGFELHDLAHRTRRTSDRRPGSATGACSGRRRAAERPGDRDAVEFRHLQVEVDEVGSFRCDQRECFGTRLCLADELDAAGFAQEPRQLAARGRFVVGDDGDTAG
jgi:hypothetical protein